MRLFYYFCVILIIFGGKIIYSQQLLSGPETVVYDSLYQRYLVSNMNSPCYITAIDHDGNYSIFYEGLNWPHGITIVDSVLYVTTNMGANGGILGIDLATGSACFYIFLPEWYYGANGLTADTSGHLYLACGFYDVYRITISDRNVIHVASGMYVPNGLHFDALNNRVLIPNETWKTEIYSIDCNTLNLTSITVPNGRYSCITEDQQHNIYISCFWENQVWRFDNSFTGEPELVALADSPEGIYFNKRYSTLVIPHLHKDSLSFIPLDIDLWMESDTCLGQVPLEVNFEGFSAFDISAWFWDFGDGDTAGVPSPRHTYERPGHYDVTIRANTTAGDTLIRVYPNFVAALADTLSSLDYEIIPDSVIEVVLNLRHSVAINEIILPVEWTGDLNLNFDSFSTVGGLIETFENQNIIHYDSSAKCMTFDFKLKDIGSPLFLPASEGPLVKLYFHAVEPVIGQVTHLQFDGYDSYGLLLKTNGFDYVPYIKSGLISFIKCCIGTTGNTDCSEAEEPDISDITRIIDYLYISHKPLCCPGEADVNKSGGEPDISDITNLIDYLYISHEPLMPCD